MGNLEPIYKDAIKADRRRAFSRSLWPEVTVATRTMLRGDRNGAASCRRRIIRGGAARRNGAR